MDAKQTLLQANRISIAAGSAALCGVMLGHPFDCIKTRMQAYRYKSTFACIREIWTTEGLAGFYKAVGPVLLTHSILRATSFTIYNTAKVAYAPVIHSTGLMDLSAIYFTAVLAGATSGSVIGTLSAPLEFIKVQRQLEVIKSRQPLNQTKAPPLNGSTLQWGKHIIRNFGILSLFKGYPTHLLRDVVGTSFFFSCYESIKYSLTPSGKESHPLVHMLGGGLAGTLVWIVILPIDTAKSVIQREALNDVPKFKKSLEFIKSRVRRHGILGLYSGLQPQLVRSFPIHALSFLIYEKLIKELA